MKKQLYQLNWEVLSAAELICQLPKNAPVPHAMYMQIYSGNGLRLMGEGRKPRKWGVTITTTAKANNGEIHTLKMSYKPDQPLFLSTLINMVKQAWLDECDDVLADMTAIRADAVARVMA